MEKKKTRKKRIFGFIAIALSIIIATGCWGVYFCFFHHYKGKEKDNLWSERDIFDISELNIIEKSGDEDFIILNLADIQLCDTENFFNKIVIKKELDYLIERVKPDLITLTGDQTWSNENLLSLKSLIRWLDGYKIPYAPVFGNHDYGNEYDSAVASLNYCCDLYEKGKYSLFDRGPSNMGRLGNYAFLITDNGKPLRVIYMIDAGYGEEITPVQYKYVKWLADGIKNTYGKYIEGMCFMHKPLPEHKKAYDLYSSGSKEVTAVTDVNVFCSLNGLSQTGFFDLLKSRNVKDVVCGHQHINNFTLSYKDVRLTFALKTGELSFYYDDGMTNLNGGTVFKFNKEDTVIENVCVPSGEFHIEGTDNYFDR